MANKFYLPGEQRSAKVQDLFAAIAPRYDLINDLQSFGLHRLWKRRLIAQARPRRGERFLDLCCGTGDVAAALAQAGAEVCALDFSEPMLRVAQRRKLPDGIRWIRGDALHTPFPDEEFDGVTIAYGLRNLASFEGALSEMLRVLKPGGRLCILDFGKPENPLWRQLYFFYLGRFVPLFGKIFCGDSATHGYILESLRHYPAQRGIAALLKERNCRNVRTGNILGGIMSISSAEKAS